MEINSLDKYMNNKKSDSKPHNNFELIPSAPRRCLFIGSTGSGKSHNVISLLIRKEFLKDFYNEIHLYSPNALFEDEYGLIKKYNKKTLVKLNDEFVPEEFDKLIDEIKIEQKTRKSDKKKMKNILIIVDDFITDKRFFNNKSLNDAFIQLRKYNCSTWILSQLYKKIPVLWRTNSEHLVIFSQPKSEVKKLSEELSVGKYDHNFFKKMFSRVADENYSFIHVNRKLPPFKRFYFTYQYMIDVAH